MLKIAGSITGIGCTDFYCARRRSKGTAHELDLPSLTPLYIAGCGRLQLGSPLGYFSRLLQVVDK